MKTKIQNINYDGKLVKNGRWWRWIQKCDRCGKVIFDYSHQSMEKPNTDKADFCSDCITYLMDNDISYEEAKEKYKK